MAGYVVCSGCGGWSSVGPSRNLGAHDHGFGTNSTGSHSHPSDTHSHTVTVGSTTIGTATPTPVTVDPHQPSVAVNYLIWT
jgi:hypothetical protein